MSLADLAHDFMIFAHAGQKDNQGEDYYLHPERVGRAVAHLGEEYECAGYLHDTVEDNPEVTLDDIRRLFGERIAVALDGLTKRKGETHAERVLRADKDPIAREVKKEDMQDNLRPGGSESLRKRYIKGLAVLGAKPRLS